MDPADKNYGISPFSGENFDNWQFRVKTVLKKEGVLRTIWEDSPRKDAPAQVVSKWEEDNATAEAIIVSFIAESHLQYVREENSAKKMWENLAKASTHSHACGVKEVAKNHESSNVMVKKDELSVEFVSCKEGIDSDEVVWVLDLEASHHQTNLSCYFNSFKCLRPPIAINTAKDGQSIKARKVGDIEAISMSGEDEHKLTLKNVHYAPELRCNLLSIKKMTERGAEVNIVRGEAKIIRNGKTFGIAKNINGFYEWRMSCKKVSEFVEKK